MPLKNYTEVVASEELERLLEADPEFCRCDRCRNDVLAIALNSLRGRYVASEEGDIRAAVATQADRQLRADVIRALLSAKETVREHPHHGANTSPASGG